VDITHVMTDPPAAIPARPAHGDIPAGVAGRVDKAVQRARVRAVQRLAAGESVITGPSPLNALKDTNNS
jgi:hypothetical protein